MYICLEKLHMVYVCVTEAGEAYIIILFKISDQFNIK